MTTYADLRSTDARAQFGDAVHASADYPTFARVRPARQSDPRAVIVYLFVAWCVILAAVGWWLAGALVR